MDDDADDDWAEEPETLEDESRSDDPDLDAVDTYGFLEEQRWAARVARRQRAKEARQDLYRLSRHDKKNTPKSPLATKKETTMYPNQQQPPKVQGLDGPFQDQSGVFYVDQRNGQRVDANYVMAQLNAPRPPQPQQPPQGPQGYPQQPPQGPQGYPQQPPQGYPQPQPGGYPGGYPGGPAMPGGRPMHGGAMPPPQTAPNMNTNIYGGNAQPHPMEQSPVAGGGDFDRTDALRRRNQPEGPAMDPNQRPVGNHNEYIPRAQPAAQPRWDEAEMVEAEFTADGQSSQELRVSSETLAAIYVGGIKVPVSYNHRTHVALPLAQVDGTLIDCLVPKRRVKTMDKMNHMVGVHEVEPVDEKIAQTEEANRAPVNVPKDAVHTTSAVECTSMEQSLVMVRRMCAEKDYQMTVMPFTTDISLCIFPSDVADDKGDVAEALAELNGAAQAHSFSAWVEAFKSLLPILVDNEMASAARYINRKATDLANDILARVLSEPVDLDNGFQLDVHDMITYLKDNDRYLDFDQYFMGTVGQVLELEVGEMAVEGTDYAVLMNCESGYAVGAAVDVTLQDGDKGICHPLKPGLITTEVTEDLYEVCRTYGAYMQGTKNLPLYFYVTSIDGGWVKVARSCTTMSAMDCFYVVDSGC